MASEAQVISREEFDALWEAYLDFALRLQEKDRHERGGTTLGELWDSEEFGEAFISVLRDPAYISHQVAGHLRWWLGERDAWGAKESELVRNYGYPPGIIMLGREDTYGQPLPTPQEVARRAARAKSMGTLKGENRVRELTELATLCLDLADAFEGRLEAEGGIRRIK